MQLRFDGTGRPIDYGQPRQGHSVPFLPRDMYISIPGTLETDPLPDHPGHISIPARSRHPPCTARVRPAPAALQGRCPPSPVALGEPRPHSGFQVLVWKKKSRRLKKRKLTQVGAKFSCELWQVCKLTGAGLVYSQGGGPSCKSMQLTTAPLLRNRRLISSVLNESLWRNC